MYLKCIHHTNHNTNAYWAGLFFCQSCGTQNSLRDTTPLPFSFPTKEIEKKTSSNTHLLDAPNEVDIKPITSLTTNYYVAHNSQIFSNFMLSINVYGDLIVFTTGIDFQPQSINQNSGKIYVISLDEFENQLNQKEDHKDLDDSMISKEIKEFKFNFEFSNDDMFYPIVDVCVHKNFVLFRTKNGTMIIPAPHFRSSTSRKPELGTYLKDTDFLFPNRTYQTLKDRFLTKTNEGLVNWQLYSSMMSLKYDKEQLDEVFIMLREKEGSVFLHFVQIVCHQNDPNQIQGLEEKSQFNYRLTDHIDSYRHSAAYNKYISTAFYLEKRDVGHNRFIVSNPKIILLFNYTSSDGPQLKIDLKAPHNIDFIPGTLQATNSYLIVKAIKYESIETKIIHLVFWFTNIENPFEIDEKYGVPSYFWLNKNQEVWGNQQNVLDLSIACLIDHQRYVFADMNQVTPSGFVKANISQILSFVPQAFIYKQENAIWLNVHDQDSFLIEPNVNLLVTKFFTSIAPESHVWLAYFTQPTRLEVKLLKW